LLGHPWKSSTVPVPLCRCLFRGLQQGSGCTAGGAFYCKPALSDPLKLPFLVFVFDYSLGCSFLQKLRMFAGSTLAGRNVEDFNSIKTVFALRVLSSFAGIADLARNVVIGVTA